MKTKAQNINPDFATESEVGTGILVAESILGKMWIFREADARRAEGISQAYNLPEIVGRVLAARGVEFDQVETFLNPTLKAQLPDPSSLKDMDKAAERIADAIMKGENVAVFGDYDVDGATSSALLKRFFKSLGRDLRIYIPDRIVEGYGPKAPALLKLKDEGIKLVVTVDCGATAFDALEAGTKAGLDIVVLDHHRAEARLPHAYAVVNPNRLDCESGQEQIAAVGVTFLAIVAANRVLRTRGFYNERRIEPRILEWLDLVALGTVCDVVPLTGVNRAFVAQGLRVMALRRNAGIAALCDIAGVSSAPTTFHAGFALGPRVNAGGRVGESHLGATLLATDDLLEAKTLALRLHDYNAERRQIEDAVLEQALECAEKIQDDQAMIVSGDGWHPGVIGIVAARLKEKYNRPVCVVAFDDRGIGKSSGRSVPKVDLGAAVIAAKQRGLLIDGGGHAMAAGFTVVRDQIEPLRAALNDHIAMQMEGGSRAPELQVDGLLSVRSLTLDLMKKIDMLAPYGAGHSEPRFVLKGVRIAKPAVVGADGKHVSCFLQDASGGGGVKAIAFRAMDSALGEALLKAGQGMFMIAGHANINEWQGKISVNFQIVDVARSW